MGPTYFMELAEEILAGKRLTREELIEISQMPDDKIFYLMSGANLIKEHYFKNSVQLCSIQNAKSGRCPEDCAFCSQSAHAQTEIQVYDFVGAEAVLKAMEALDSRIHRFSVVTSGRALSIKHVKEIAFAYSQGAPPGLKLCASLGSIGKEELQILKEAGLSRYHHNIETAPSFFPKICSTHSFEERIRTIQNAKEIGLEVCSGGIFGMGETDAQVIEMAMVLRELDVDAVPCNFLTPIKGTKLGHMPGPEPIRCLKIISLLRYALPEKEIIICGGREQNLKELHPFVFFAGASGIMTGNYLTTKGRNCLRDIELIEDLRLSLRKASSE